MRGESTGWWTLEAPDLPAGTDYWFAVDGGPPMPDPRSPHQPSGVHGPSRTVDHAAFGWHDHGWRATPLDSAVLYELHVGTFTPAGTFDGVLSRIDHLVELGVTHVEIMPVAEFPGSRGWGYDTVDLYAPHHAYGGPEGLKRLVDGCHARGLAVVLDVVLNHFGPDGNYLGRFGPYVATGYQTPWGAAPNLDQAECDEVRRFLCDNALFWLREYHLDGLRLDAVHALLDRSACHLLEMIATDVAALQAELQRPLVLIAESDLNDPRLIREPGAGGYGLHAQWNDDFHHALHAVITGECSGYYVDYGGLEPVARALRDGFVYTGQYSGHRRRRHGRPATGVPLRRFVGYLQTHDQVGNRARGDRIGQCAPLERVKVGMGLVFCSPFVPMLFQGEEWNASSPFHFFTDHQNPDLARAVTAGRRKEFAALGWPPDAIADPQRRSTFERSRLDWSEVARPEHQAVLNWTRRLISLRRDHPEVTAEPREVSCDETAGLLVVSRQGCVLGANLGSAPRRVAVPPGSVLRLGSRPEVGLASGEMVLPPDSMGVVVQGR
jgi:maltooligosyltrehalose trehalohydrolase